MMIHAAEAHDIETRIAEATEATEALARQFFGPAAYLRRDVHEDRETGEEKTVFEVHYCFPDPQSGFDRLAALHDAFMHAAVRAISRDVLPHIVLEGVPTDAD
ncbi:MAG TPA: hypothetical protein VFJ16_26100 [Longimicrobium sp.]|nr:hypothetical protein [Longimicrobium sp.]